jgi:hypothetical protein
MNNPEFYVGYVPRAPAGVSRTMKRVSVALLLGGALAAVVLLFAQTPFASSRFEFGQYRDFEGVVRAQPVPMLVGARPYLLVAPGKHGFDAAALDGRRVHVRGSLIERGEDRMIEVLEAGDREIRAGTAAPRVLGVADLRGEIVDSKCYLGVMNPGNGKVHRDCAVRCISGGVPPGFVVRDRNAHSRTLLLASDDDRPLTSAILGFIAEPVRIKGTLVSSDGVLILRTNAREITRE